MKTTLQQIGKVLPVICLFFSFAFTEALGQHEVTGSVTDSETGEPLIGVNILVADTEVGTSTDSEGNFEIEAPSADDVLVFNYLGYESEEVPIQGRGTIDVALDQTAIMGEDIVVVGYGQQRAEQVTSSISSISADDFIESSARDLGEVLQGQIPGLNINFTSGDPVAGSEINLRGITSLAGGASPLILIDGVPGDLNTVPPEDIESVSVLKDGSAAAIYGTRGANGVIQITTTRHEAGQPPTIEYETYVDRQEIVERPNMLDAEDYRRLIDEGYGFTDQGHETNWLDEILRNPISHTHNLRVSGGFETTTYTAALNFRRNEGIMERSNNQDLTGRINVDHYMFDGQLNASVNLISDVQNYWAGGDGFSFNNYIYRQAIIRNPTERIKDEGGNYEETPGYFYDNPIQLLHESDGENENRELRMYGTLTYMPSDNLSFEVMGSNTRWTQIRGYSESYQHVSTTQQGLNGYASRGADATQQQLLEITGTYDNSFGAHDFDLLGGYSWQYDDSEGFWANTYDFPTDLFKHNQLSAGQAIEEGDANMDSYKSDETLIGFFSRANYSWANRYSLMVSARYEGSSKFGDDEKWGLFPAFSAGWRISQESFMDGVDFISNLRIRGGWGLTGIEPAAPYQSLTSFGFAGSMYDDGNWVPGLVPTRNPNPNLKWEEKAETNLGVNFGFLEDRITGSLDVYRRDTQDMLWDYDVPVPPNLYGSITANVGTMRNEGIEADINVDIVQTPDVFYGVGMNYSTNRNELVSLSDDLYETAEDWFYAGWTGEPVQMPTHRVEIGEEIGNFYAWEAVDINDEGEWIVLNQEGEQVHISEAGEADRRVVGNGIPNHNLAMNHTLRFQNFDLRVTMRGAFDYQILNQHRLYYENPSITQYNMLESAFDDVFGKRPVGQDLTYVDYYIEDGDYIKIDNVTLGYNFNVAQLPAISHARIYVSGRNLFTFTDYEGLDPEVSATGLTPGVEPRDHYPTTRTFTLGAKLRF